MDQLAIGHDHGTLHAVFQFAHIARPIPPVDGGQRIAGKAGHLRVHFRCKAFDECLGQQRCISGPFRERRDAYHDLGEPIEQVFAERSVRDHLFQVLMRGAHDACVHRNRLARADPFDRAFLQEA